MPPPPPERADPFVVAVVTTLPPEIPAPPPPPLLPTPPVPLGLPAAPVPPLPSVPPLPTWACALQETVPREIAIATPIARTLRTRSHPETHTMLTGPPHFRPTVHSDGNLHFEFPPQNDASDGL